MTAVLHNHPLVVPVAISSWQMECCGQPFAVGDEVAWQLCWWPDDDALVPTSLDLTVDVAAWNPKADDPAYGADPYRPDDTRVPALASCGALRVFTSTHARLPDRVHLVGVLWEDHHGRVPLDLPHTAGIVRAIDLVSFEFTYVDEMGSPRLWQVPGTQRLEPVTRCPKWFDWQHRPEGQTTPWRPGAATVLVELEVAGPRSGRNRTSPAEPSP